MAREDQIDEYRFDKRTPEEQRKIAVMGGIASGKARQEKATMRKTLEMLLNTKNKKGVTYRELSTLGLIKGAIDGKAENYKVILQLLGELNTIDESKNNGVIDDLVEALKNVKKD